MDFKDDLIAQSQEMKPEHLDMERRQLQEEQELTAEQEDYMLESALEDERIAREGEFGIGGKSKIPTTFEMTIQRLRKEKEEKGWTSTEYFERIDQEAVIELEEHKRELELAYGID